MNDPRTIPLWQPILAKFTPTFPGECEKAITWSTSLAAEWLARIMLADAPNRAELIGNIVKELADHSVSLAHNRHLSAAKCREIGLVVHDLESNPVLHDKVLSVHHIYFHTLSTTPVFKIIENEDGVAFILRAPGAG